MQKHRFSLTLTVIAAVLVLWLGSRNMGQELQSAVVSAPDDIAAWQDAVFVLEGDTLTKLNAQLEVVKSVPLPLEPMSPNPPKPVPELPGERVMEESEMPQQVPPIETAGGGRICADAGKVYVLYEGVIFTFDHDLNYLMSKARDFSR